MPCFELTIEIARQPEDVFAYLTDLSKLPEWQASATGAEADGPIAAGTRIRERRTFIGRDVGTDLEVVTYEPPTQFDVRSRGGPVAYSIRHTLTASASGTQLHVEADVKVGAMMRIAAQGPLKLAEREFRGDFARLKEILESRA